MDVTISTRHITRAYRQASPVDLAEGREWYASARKLADHLDPSDPVRAAAVIAVLSPQLSWPRNVQAAREMYAGVEPRGVLRRNVEKARRILAGDDPDAVVTGPKVRAFWHTIADPSNLWAVVIDRHAIDIAAGRVLGNSNRDRFLGRKGNYDAACDAYRRAARILSHELDARISPAEVQATTWLHWRRRHALANHG